MVWLCLALCALALFATPYGKGSLGAWLAIMQMSLPDLIIEHAPLHPATPQGLFAILLLVVYVVVLAVAPRAWSRPSFYLPLVWFVLTCLRIRHAPLFAIVAGYATADLLPESRISPWLRRRGWLRPASSRPDELALPHERDFGPVAGRLMAIVLIVTAPLFAASIWLKQVGPLPLVGSAWARPPDKVWPADLIDPLSKIAGSHAPGGAAVFNEPILGGFLIYQFPQLRVFIDGRCELYGEAFLRDFVAAWQNPDRVGQWERQFRFRAALLENGSPLERYFRAQPSWQEVKRSTSTVLYLRGSYAEKEATEDPARPMDVTKKLNRR